MIGGFCPERGDGALERSSLFVVQLGDFYGGEVGSQLPERLVCADPQQIVAGRKGQHWAVADGGDRPDCRVFVRQQAIGRPDPEGVLLLAS